MIELSKQQTFGFYTLVEKVEDMVANCADEYDMSEIDVLEKLGYELRSEATLRRRTFRTL